jgi:glycosyltransferase involved in cell wall biosynthesis
MPECSAGISLCMIVRNEERFLAAALESVADVVDEICIVDTGSTDGTREIALAHGARVVDVPWRDDFAFARNAALALATRRWIFVLDADERLDPGSRAALAAIGRSPTAGRGKWITCHNATDNVKGSGAMSNAIVRIFPNEARIRYRNPIHEFVAFDGCEAGLPSDRSSIAIVHHGYLSAVVAGRAKGERNLRLSRLAAERDPADAFHQYNLGMASLLAGDRDAAIAALDRMRDLTRATPRAYRVHGLISLAHLYADHRGDRITAHRLVRECLSLVPNYSNAHFAQGVFLARDGAFHAARDSFGRAIAAGTHDAEQFVVDNEIAIWKAHSEIGATLMHERRFGEALAWFELASRSRPGAQPLVINRAKCHEELGEFEAARELFTLAFDTFHDAPSTIEWINFLLRRERSGDALAAIETALPFMDDETGVVLLGTSAAVHLRAGHTAHAQRCVDRAVERGDRAAASASIEVLAEQLRLPELAALLPAPVRARAAGLSIAYVAQR